MALADPVAWTFAAGGEVSTQLTWLTDALQAKTGPAQHRRLRTAPRTGLRFSGLESGHRRRRLEALLYVNGSGQWRAPLVMQTTVLQAELLAASGVVAVDVGSRRFVAGGHALLMGNDPLVYEVVEINAVASNSLTLAAVTTLAWPAGTRVLPLYTGRLEGMPSLSRFTGDDVPYQVQFRLEDLLEWPANAGPAAYRSLPVLEIRPTWTSDPEWSPERELDTVDAETGPISVFDLIGLPRPKQTMQFVLTGQAEFDAFAGLLYALCGRWGVIWVPSWAQDLRVVANVANGATTLDVQGSILSEWPLQINRRDLRIELSDGTVLYRRVTAAVEQTTTVDRLTLDAPIATGFTTGQVATVSFMALCRQDTDVNLLRYWTFEVVQSELTFRAVVDDL